MAGSMLQEAAAAAGAALAGAGVWLWRNGSLARWRESLRGGETGLNGHLDDIEETLDEVRAGQERALDVAVDTQEDVRRVEAKVDAVGETVYRLHEDDPLVTDADALRDVLDVEDLEDDFMRGGHDE